MGLKINELEKRYGSHIALNRISLTIKPKSIFGLLGPNGAGKTSLIRILSGLVKADKGEIEVGKLDFKSHQKEVKQIVGIVPQFRNLDLESTVYENLYFHGKLYNINQTSLKKEIDILLNRFNLVDKKNTQIKKLSGGTQQKILIIRSLVTRPQLLIMDEPSVGLDPHSRIEMWNFVKEIKQNHTILLATQDLNEADFLSDEIGIINQGKLIKQGTPKELKENNNNLSNIFLRVQVSVKIIEEFTRGLELLIKNNILLNYDVDKEIIRIRSSKIFINNILEIIVQYKIIDLRVYEPTLEEVFINLTKK